ncbi:MAG: hypothetical protein UU21_C0006G0014 [Candidatus Levybacteria bacterium GW2011_GWA2_40_8]|nr:MAG: hypothetical protein UU21_C0006G0014 [Candidatus Levybacteria bacterium GW2011_GWA2_40_8]
MLQTKKTKKQNRRKRILVFIFFLGYVSLFLLLTGFVWVGKLFPKTSLISPVSTQSQKSLGAILDKKNISYESVEKLDGYYLVKIIDGGEVLISDKKDLTEQASSLQLIVSRLKIEGKKFKRLDFRFDRPVIKF